MLQLPDPIQNLDQSKTGLLLIIQIGIQIPAEDTLVWYSDHGLQTENLSTFYNVNRVGIQIPD